MTADPRNLPSLTPLLEQYFALKKECPDALLLFRVGDFYEAYGDDGKTLSQALDIVLTGKETRSGRVPMSGVPHHTLDNHVKTLLAKGHKVAVSEQLEEASQAKGLIDRNIVRFLTPGTILESDLLTEREPNFLAAIFPAENKLGLSWADVSTGSWYASVLPLEEDALRHELAKIAPKEILAPEGSTFLSGPTLWKDANVCYVSDPRGNDAQNGLVELPPEARQACVLLQGYLERVYRGNMPHLSPPMFDERKNYLVLDPVTCRNLELFQTLTSNAKEGSLLYLLDKTKTPMGGRLLRHWLFYPLLDVLKIKCRQDGIGELVKHPTLLSGLRNALSFLGDLERLTSRVSFQTAHAGDLLAIKTTLEQLPKLKTMLAESKAAILLEFLDETPEFSSLSTLLEKALRPNPPLSLKEGELIKDGFHPELDVMKNELREATQWIADLEEKEKKATGIKSLKVVFNQVFGYSIEITKSNLPLAPNHYIRKQTLTNAERFVTEELKIQEAKILGAQEKVKNLEYKIFCDIRAETKHHEEALRKCAFLLAQLDVLAGLAETAIERNFCRPEVTDGDVMAIQGGRHPVVEACNPEPFVPNDAYLDLNENRLLIITGPNMAGKSTYLRQVALIGILAQMGSFVPAKAARIGIADRIFTRIGASDDLHRGESTFYIEMKETAEILKKATRKSLVLLDEIGRGTSTFDGLSLAWATAEELLRLESKVLFATHYHEMTSLAERHSGAKNFTVAVKEDKDNIIFLRQIISGSADKSYGIHVAGLAGIPRHVVERAKEILVSLEDRKLERKVKNPKAVQLQLLSPLGHGNG